MLDDLFALVIAILLFGAPIILLFLGPLLNFLDRKKEVQEGQPSLPAVFELKAYRSYIVIAFVLIFTLPIYYFFLYRNGYYTGLWRLVLFIIVICLYQALNSMNLPSILNLYPYRYERHKLLRRLFETLAISNGVKVSIEDRGI